MKILYWNINNNLSSFDLLRSEIKKNIYSLICFSEYWKIVKIIDFKSNDYKIWVDPVNPRIGIIYSNQINFSVKKINRYYIHGYFSYNELTIEIYLLHFRSQLRSNINAFRITENLSMEITKEINENKKQFVLIIGDFNLSNYHEIFLNGLCFNVLNYYSRTSNDYKIIEDRKYLKFYSPLSSFHGDLSPGPVGTYYYNSVTSSQSWQVFDQILISYPLVKYMEKKAFIIHDKIGEQNLLTNMNLPNKNFSDHLPISCKLS